MGGGAGVNFTADTEHLTISVSKINGKWEYLIPEINLYKFDIKGYEDGLINVKGDMLESKLFLQLDDDELDQLIQKYTEELMKEKEIENIENIEFVDIDIEYEITLNDMLWGGFIRGDIKDVENFNCDVDITNVYLNFKINGLSDFIELEWDDYFVFDKKLEAYFIKREPEEFDNMFNMIFKSLPTPSQEEIDEYREMNGYEQDMSDEQITQWITEIYYQDIVDNYTIS